MVLMQVAVPAVECRGTGGLRHFVSTEPSGRGSGRRQQETHSFGRWSSAGWRIESRHVPVMSIGVHLDHGVGREFGMRSSQPGTHRRKEGQEAWKSGCERSDKDLKVECEGKGSSALRCEGCDVADEVVGLLFPFSRSPVTHRCLQGRSVGASQFRHDVTAARSMRRCVILISSPIPDLLSAAPTSVVLLQSCWMLVWRLQKFGIKGQVSLSHYRRAKSRRRTQLPRGLDAIGLLPFSPWRRRSQLHETSPPVSAKTKLHV